jgi:recombination protein RecT
MTQVKTAAQPAATQKELSTEILNKVNLFVETGELKIPSDYSPANAIKGAFLILQELKDKDKVLVMSYCSKNSIAQALFKMVVEGLSPLKKQGYFIPYGKELSWSRSYQGSIALAKRVGGVSDIVANIIYKNDVFEYAIDVETGYKKIVKHTQEIANINNAEIIGAYAVIIYTDGKKDLEVMTYAEIMQAWKQGATKGTSGAHTNFTQEMAKKTVINRACKQPINASNDFYLLDGDDDTEKETTTQTLKQEIQNETAAETVTFEDVTNEKAINQEAGAVEFETPNPQQEELIKQPSQNSQQQAGF